MARHDREPFRCLPISGESFWSPGEPDERRTALREAAYIRRTKFVRGKLLHDFACRSEDLFMLTPVVPPGAPDWVKRPFLRWRRADEAAKGQTGERSVAAWHVCADLPAGLSRGEWMDGTEALVRDVLPPNIVAEFVGHLPEDDPPHVHIMVAARRVATWRYGDVIPELPDILQIEMKSRWLEWVESSKLKSAAKMKKAA